MPVIGSNVKVEVQKTLAAAITITAITKANPAVITYTGTDPVNGDVLVLDVSGMGELDGQAVRLAAVDSVNNTAQLEGIDSTTFGTFTSGTGQVVSAWDTFSLSTSINSDEQTPKEIDATTLLDKQDKIIYGNLSAAKGSFGSQWEATDVALVNLRAATKTKSTRAFRVTFSDGQKLVFNAMVAVGDLPQLETGDIAKCTVSWTLQGYMAVPYAS